MSLEKEKETYLAKLSELEQDEGKYVLIHGAEVVEVFESYADALSYGYDKFGLEPFLVKLIEGTERVQLVTRLITG